MAEAAGTIVGRTRPRSQLLDAVARADTGDRTAVFVSATAGMGKTSLVRDALTADGGGPVVAWGTCWHARGAPAFWPWTQALDAVWTAVGEETARETAGPRLPLLASLLSAPEAPVDDGLDPETRRVLLLDAADRWLSGLARDTTIVLVLDDLQWADTSTLDLLEYVTTSPTPARLCLIGCYRHDEPDASALGRLADIVTRGVHLHLGGLSPDEVAELITPIVGAEAATTRAPGLHRRTGGHPLFATELARLGESGSGWGGGLPTAVTGAVDRRLGLLPDDTRALLDAAAVAGNRILPDVLAAITGQTPSEVLAGLDPAREAGVVETRDAGGVWFAHDLFRETLYAELDTARRTDLHLAVAHALEARHARGGEVAPGQIADHHCRALASGDVDAALRWTEEAAADERRRSAFDEAAGHLRRLRTAVEDTGTDLDPACLVRLLTAEADDRARGGDPDAARQLLARAQRMAPDPAHLADVALAVQSLGSRFAARRDDVVAQLSEALAAVAGTDTRREARVTAALARELRHSVPEDRRRAGPLSERALELGRQADDPATLTDCLLARHDAIWEPGTGAERAELGREIAAAGAAAGHLDREAEGLLLQANGLLEAGSAAYRPVLDRWFGLLEGRDQPRDRYMVRTRRAALALLEGDHDRAATLIAEAVELGEAIREPDTGNVHMSQRVALSRLSGDPDELRSLAHDAVAWWTGAPLLAHAVAAGALAGAGDVDEAAREVAVVTGAGLDGEDSYLRSVLIGHLADAVAAIGDTGLCASLLADIEPLAGACGVNGAVVAFAGPFAHPAGILAAAIGDRERARRLLVGAATTARSLGARAWARRSEEALARLDDASPRGGTPVTAAAVAPTPDGVVAASLIRSGRIWSVAFGQETGAVAHVKGLGDIACLIRYREREISALELAAGPGTGLVAPGVDVAVDRRALAAYRSRLADIDAEIDEADRHADRERSARLAHEREALLAELRRATGLGGRARPSASDPAERARKAVSARIRDAIRRLEVVAPGLAAHLDRSIRTGLHCVYAPPVGEETVTWEIDEG